MLALILAIAITSNIQLGLKLNRLLFAALALALASKASLKKTDSTSIGIRFDNMFLS